MHAQHYTSCSNTETFNEDLTDVIHLVPGASTPVHMSPAIFQAQLNPGQAVIFQMFGVHQYE